MFFIWTIFKNNEAKIDKEYKQFKKILRLGSSKTKNQNNVIIFLLNIYLQKNDQNTVNFI